MDLWRETAEFALSEDAGRLNAEQKAWIAAEPSNAKPYYHLAALLRSSGDRARALGLLLEAVRLDGSLAPAHAALAEMYAVAGDPAAAWRHAIAARDHGDDSAALLLERHRVPVTMTERELPG